MKISIVIPSLNSVKFLRHTLESIFSQSYRNFEVIVVDSNSQDGTQRILEEYNKKYNSKFTWAHTSPMGQSDAINKGMQLATGDIVAYICADDTYRTECFENVVKCFKRHHKVQWLYGKGEIIDSTGREVRGFITKSKEFLQPRYSYTVLQCVDFIVQPTVFMRREFYKQIGGFNPDLRFVMDYEYWLRAGKVSKPYFVNKYLANWRAHSGSLSEREHKAEARQAFEVQKLYSHWWLRPTQWKVCWGTIFLYRAIGLLNRNGR
ncbi:glycosyltransferase [Patescibacteria group bacterium]|nr:glycosyltransferase [Patescibacteria group bacterium]